VVIVKDPQATAERGDFEAGSWSATRHTTAPTISSSPTAGANQNPPYGIADRVGLAHFPILEGRPDPEAGSW